MADDSVKTIRGLFATREGADLAMEHLSQEQGINRADIFVQAADSRNTAGTAPSGGDSASGDDTEPRRDGALQGEIEVSADISADKLVKAEQVFRQAGARQVDIH
jgi:hypothetical protein